MSSVEYLREFVNERLTAAAEEIFRVFKKTIIEYEEEIDRQRKLLDIVWKPEIKLHRIELPQQHVCKEEEVLADQQLCIQERNSSLDQEDPEPPQIKEEQEELCTSQEGEQLELKQETETFMLTPTDEESDHSEDQTLNFNIDKSQSTAETELPASMCNSWLKNESDWENPEISEPNSDHQLLSHNSHVAESQDQKGGKNGDSGSTSNEEPKPQTRHQKCTSHSDNIYNSTMGKKSFKCDTCEKAFENNSDWQRHLRSHTGKKSYSCNTCGKRFTQKSILTNHIRIHTGETFTCKTCGKDFSRNSDLSVHMRRAHTGEKPYLCKICGKDFCRNSDLLLHMRRVHTGENPYSCNTCGKNYFCTSDLRAHIRIHTGEKPYSCNTCGKRFTQKSTLNVHIQIHSGKKPFTCKTCGKDFSRNSNLLFHIRRVHTGEKLFTCKTCGKDFSSNSELLLHMRRVHNGEKPYLCKICGKRWFDAYQLARHVRSHTGK
ncbi:uncharacterized protein LOC141769763 [Sebastes fasciatus]|uniref:uncharacterized protein LOC141769763 n=1 Tax=Sebastes fasciatus TaxID=394691 RepID=UPI003D9FA778